MRQVITVIDCQPIVGERGENLHTPWFQLSAGLTAGEVVVEAEALLGDSAVAAILQEASGSRTTVDVSDRIDVCCAGRWLTALKRPTRAPLRLLIEVVCEEMPYVEWVPAPAQLLLTLRLLAREDE